jgi:hypothetical protein
MQEKYFIQSLSQKKSDYKNPEQAIDQANSCDSLSSDIYTDSKRFIYELLQNADDASCKSGKLDFQIDFVGEFIIVSHKGEPFTEIDIKSICSVGDGNKKGDENKTGFKGIGFKSVFAHSDFVIIKSGKYCFKFDKQISNKWNSNWGDEGNWKAERLADNKDDAIKMPWQIIPIWSAIPENLNHLSVFNQDEFNVSTIIKHEKLDELKDSLVDLFSKSQIILFLRSKQIKITINTTQKLVLEKTIIHDDIATIKQDNLITSEWLIKNEQFDIPNDIQSKIRNDNRYPRKLRESQRTEISFAVQIEKGRLKPADEDKRLIFTFLPTSINYGLPFLVNANFLTDAGRESIHKDLDWNQWLFTQIPIKYFEWISDLANLNSKFNRQFLTVLPQKLNGFNELESKFNQGYKTAIESIAFIPNQQGKLIKVADAIYDETNISEFISKQTLINYINSDLDNQYTISSFIPQLKPINVLKQLGVKIFRIEELDGFFKSDIFSSEHIVAENFKLISFLFNQATNSKKGENADDWNYRLKNIPFIFDENEKLQRPEIIYFPAVEYSEEFQNEISIINETVLDEINESQTIKNWLESLGVKEPTDVTFIEKTIIGDSDYINEDNAIKIGRYLFKAKIDGILSDQHFSNLKHVNFLTKNGTLKKAQDCFLADFYEPELKLEKVSDIDFFISEAYFENKDLKSEWKTFFLKIGINEDVEWSYQTIKFDYQEEWKNRFDKDYLEKVWDASRKYSWISWEGWDKSGKGYGFSPNEISFKGLPFINHAINYEFSKMYFNRIFGKDVPELNNTVGVSGNTGMIGRHLSLDRDDLKDFGEHIGYTKWVLNTFPIFPVVAKECKKAQDIFNNNIPQINEISGKYLSILDYSSVISAEWQEILKLKEQLKLDDYLSILSQIWQDIELSEEEQKENKKRVLLIYEKLAELLPNLHDNDKIKLKDWCKSNKLLARDSKFYLPNELSIVSVEGFNADNLIYTENKVESSTLSLFEFLGVRVINKVTPKFSNSMVSQESLRKQLEYIAPLIALVSVEKSRNKKEWENEYNRICNKLSDITFFETTEIHLTYGNELDQQQRSTYSEGNKFYYIGNWYKPRVLDGLIEPLCKFLNIRYAERILTVLLTDIFEEGLKYLEEKGFDISLIPDNLKNPEIEERTPNQTNRHYNQSDEDLGKKGEMIVFEKLKQIYSNKYNQPVIETERGCKIDGIVEIIWRNKSENTTANHDFKVLDSSKEIYIDSKATPYNKNVEKVALYVSGNELELMEKAEKYLIARVYNATSENSSVEFVKMQLDKMTE